uniref:DUF6534 domain-containing protein n=1 Tax=Moniliophthora roreri TaxID=221103 RepID=A0A0W0FJ97_MONRR
MIEALSDPSYSYAALLLGSLVAFGLSGIVFVQSIVYFKLYPLDILLLKVMVTLVWALDAIHSACLAVGLFNYFITFRGDDSKIDHIPWSIAFSVVATAIQTLIAHCYFAHKIFKASNRNYFLTVPIIALALARVGAATVTTSQMLRLQRYSVFTRRYPGWVFTTGLSLSAGIDVIIAALLCWKLHSMRSLMSSTVLIKMVDTLTLYTLENGFLTCLAATASLICWLVMPGNLIFLGLHFIIEKLYANSLLASLNTRKELRRMGPRLSPWSDASLPVLCFEDFPAPVPPRNPLSLTNPADVDRTMVKSRKALEVNVQQVTVRTSEELPREAVPLPRRPPTILRWQPRSAIVMNEDV